MMNGCALKLNYYALLAAIVGRLNFASREIISELSANKTIIALLEDTLKPITLSREPGEVKRIQRMQQMYDYGLTCEQIGEVVGKNAYYVQARVVKGDDTRCMKNVTM